jgi:hypothetical protein
MPVFLDLAVAHFVRSDMATPFVQLMSQCPASDVALAELCARASALFLSKRTQLTFAVFVSLLVLISVSFVVG